MAEEQQKTLIDEEIPKSMIPSNEATIENVDWRADEWFEEYYADNLTHDFKTWWLNHYEGPGSYPDKHEYWVRCAFALAGWRGREGKELINQQ